MFKYFLIFLWTSVHLYSCSYAGEKEYVINLSNLPNEHITCFKLIEENIRLIIAKNSNQELYQVKYLSGVNQYILEEVVSDIPRDSSLSFFLNDSLIVFRVFGKSTILIRIRDEIIQRKQIKFWLPEKFDSANLSLEFRKSIGGNIYLNDLNYENIFEIAFNPFIDDPSLIFKMCSENRERIELNFSAYFKIENKKYRLKIPRESSSITIVEIDD